MQSFKEHTTEIRESVELNEFWAVAARAGQGMIGASTRFFTSNAKSKSGRWFLTYSAVGVLGAFAIDKFFGAGKDVVKAIVDAVTDPPTAAFIVALVTLGVTASKLPDIIEALKGARDGDDAGCFGEHDGRDAHRDQDGQWRPWAHVPRAAHEFPWTRAIRERQLCQRVSIMLADHAGTAGAIDYAELP